MSGTKREPMPTWEKLLVTLALVALVALIVLEQTDPWVRSQFVDHALLAGVVSGGLLLAPLLLIVERSLERAQRARDTERARSDMAAAEQRERRELGRWKRPAEDAIETYLYVADAFNDQLITRLKSGVRDAGVDPERPRYRDLWKVIADKGPITAFLELYAFIHDAASRSGAIAIGATNTLALYTPLNGYVVRISEVQRVTRSMAEYCSEIWHYQQVGAVPELAPAIDRSIDQLTRLAEQRAHLLAEIKLDLASDAPSVELPSAADSAGSGADA